MPAKTTDTAKPPATYGGIPTLLRRLCADMGMSRQELLGAAVDMLAAALDPAPLPARRPEFAIDVDKGVAEIMARTRGGKADATATDKSATPESRMLEALHARPPTARFTTAETALYGNWSPALLRSWRWKRKGPAFSGKGKNVRYTKANVDKFMAA
jgi:hypothetical protein